MPANNGAIQNAPYQPAMRVVTAITNESPALVTTSFPHSFYDTDIVRIIIPRGFGMQQINGLFAPITVASPTTFYIDIDTTSFDTFTDPAVDQFAQCIPISENSNTVDGATFNALPSGQR